MRRRGAGRAGERAGSSSSGSSSTTPMRSMLSLIARVPSLSEGNLTITRPHRAARTWGARTASQRSDGGVETLKLTRSCGMPKICCTKKGLMDTFSRVAVPLRMERDMDF